MPNSLLVAIQLDSSVRLHITSIWELFCQFFDIQFKIVAPEKADILISREGCKGDIEISDCFITNIGQQKFHHRYYFLSEPIIRMANGQADYLGTSFYMVNCVQEWSEDIKLDKYNRFPFSESYQAKFQCVERPLVNDYFEELRQIISQKTGFTIPSRKHSSKVVLTHDIDSLWRTFKEDIAYVLKQGNLLTAANIFLSQTKSFYPPYPKLETILDIEETYGYQSIFFWLPNSRASSIQGQKIKNSDYTTTSARIKKFIQFLSEKGWESGLHKSVSPRSFKDELKEFDQRPLSNRNHYLCFQYPNHIKQLEEAGIELDYSLGFPSEMGFRNNFGLPFYPFDLKEKRTRKVCLVPMHVMDTTFRSYKKMTALEAKAKILSFISNNQKDCLLNILWHNNYFSPYKYEGFQEVYASILQHLSDNQISGILSEGIIEERKKAIVQ